VLLAAGGLLPLAPTLAQVEAPKPEASNREEHREVVVTQSEAVSSVSGSTDVAPNLELRSDPVEKTATIGGDVVIRTQTEPETTSRIVDGRTGNVVEVRGNKIMRITTGSEIDKARAEVEQARANLEMATRRLKELEMQAKGGADAKPGWRVEAENVWGKKEPKGKYAESSGANDLKGKLKAKGDSDQERRMERLEQRMEKLDAILNELREMNQRQQSDKRNEKPTDYAPKSL
jgi:hypothetical protein